MGIHVHVCIHVNLSVEVLLTPYSIYRNMLKYTVFRILQIVFIKCGQNNNCHLVVGWENEY